MMESKMKDKSFSFAVEMVLLFDRLRDNRKEYALSKQLLRSGTSIGALIREAQNAESKADFEHKLGIAQKECDETLYWLELLDKTDYLSECEFSKLHSVANELLKMIRSAIITSRSKPYPPNKLITHNT